MLGLAKFYLSRPFSVPQRKNPKSEFRNPKRVVLNSLLFDHLNLFRISDFEFRDFLWEPRPKVFNLIFSQHLSPLRVGFFQKLFVDLRRRGKFVDPVIGPAGVDDRH